MLGSLRDSCCGRIRFRSRGEAERLLCWFPTCFGVPVQHKGLYKIGLKK